MLAAIRMRELGRKLASPLFGVSSSPSCLNVNPEALTPQDRRRLDAADGWTRLGNYAEATAELDQIDPAAQGKLDVLNARWHVRYAVRDWDDALKIAGTITESFPNCRLGFLRRALCLCKLGQFLTAISILEQAIERFGESPLLVTAIACCHCKLGNLEGGRLIVEDAIERWGMTADLNPFRGRKLFDIDLGWLWHDDE